MRSRDQWLLLIAFMIFLDIFAVLALVNPTLGKEQSPLTVSQLFRTTLLGEEVYVKGKIIEILPLYTSKKGYTYQQFIISDGKESIKIFCSQKYGKVDVKIGDEIAFEGKFQKYYEDFELVGFCSEIKIL